MGGPSDDLHRLRELLNGPHGLVVRMDRLEQAVPPGLDRAARDARAAMREIESLSRTLERHLEAAGHGDVPVVIDREVAERIILHLQDDARHAQRRQTILRVVGGGAGQVIDIVLRVLTLALLGWVAARIGIGPMGIQ